MFYSVKVTELDNGTWEGSCRDIPECVYSAASRDEALDLAKTMIPGSLELFYRRKRRPIPAPSRLEAGEEPIYITAKAQAKIALWNHLIRNHYRLSDISEMLGTKPAQTQRFVDLSKDGASMEAIEEVLFKLGLQFTVLAEPLPPSQG